MKEREMQTEWQRERESAELTHVLPKAKPATLSLSFRLDSIDNATHIQTYKNIYT